jgi:hypothetical protein
MKIAKSHSHFHAHEFLKIRKSDLLEELADIIHAASPSSSHNANNALTQQFANRGWRVGKELGEFEKDRVAVNLRFESASKASQVDFDLLSARYRRDQIDAAVQLLPVDTNGCSETYEQAVARLKRHGRSDPVLPLWILGVSA